VLLRNPVSPVLLISICKETLVLPPVLESSTLIPIPRPVYPVIRLVKPVLDPKLRIVRLVPQDITSITSLRSVQLPVPLINILVKLINVVTATNHALNVQVQTLPIHAQFVRMVGICQR